MFEIRPGCDNDKSQILELIREVFGKEDAERAERRWHWQWQEDPRLEKPGYHGMVAVWNGGVIGNLTTIPAGLYVEGKPVDAYWFADACVNWGKLRKAMRELKHSGQTSEIDLSKGLAGAMLNHPAAGFIHLGKHLTDPMAVVAYKVDSVDQPETNSWARLVSFKQPLESILGRPIGTALGWLADLFIPGFPKTTHEVKLLNADFDSRFDGLWAEVKLDYQAITRRDAATLNWRYRRHPDNTYQILTVNDENGLAGYLVYSIFVRHRQLRAQIVDILARKNNSKAFKSLLSAALHHMHREKVHKVECYAGGTTLGEELKACGFKPRLHHGKPQTVLARRLGNVELYVTRGDGDGG